MSDKSEIDVTSEHAIVLGRLAASVEKSIDEFNNTLKTMQKLHRALIYAIIASGLIDVVCVSLLVWLLAIFYH